MGADIGKGADDDPVLHNGFVELGGVDLDLVPHGAVPDHGVGAEKGVLAHGGPAPKDGAGEEQGTRPHGDLLFHIDGGGVHHQHALG